MRKFFSRALLGLILPLVLLSQSQDLFARTPHGSPLPAQPVTAVNPIGTNMSVGGAATFDYEGFPLFKNRVRQGYAWIVAGGSGFAAIDANGWPAADWQQTLYSGSATNTNITWWNGTFQCGYTSRGNGPTQAGGSETIASLNGNASISNVSYNSGTKAVLFQLTPSSTAFGYKITSTTGGGGSGGATNVFCYLPEYNTITTIDNPLLSSAFTTEALSFYGTNFKYVRYIWFNDALYNTGQNTASTRNVGGPSGNTQTHGTWTGGSSGQNVLNEGFPFEWAASFGVASGTDVYYNFPVWEDGTNGNAGTYTNSILTSAALSSLLASGHKIYIEFADELWNGSYPVGANTGETLNLLAVNAGFANSFTGGYQYLGQKIHALANAIRASSVSSYFGTQIFIVLATQGGGNGWNNFLPSTLSYMVTNYGSSAPGQDISYIETAPYTNLSNVLSAPFTDFFNGSVSGTTLTTTSSQTGIASGNILIGTPSSGSIPNGVTIVSGSGTSYVVSTSFTAGLGQMATMTAQPTISQIEANLTASGTFVPYASTGAGQQIEHMSLTALHFGMKGYMTYEGGFQVNSEIGNGQSTGNLTNLYLAMADSGFSSTMESLWSTVLDAGAVNITNYEDGVSHILPASTNYSPTDELSAAYPGIISSGSPKLAALQHYMAGTYVHTRNVVTTSGSFVSAAASADSLSTGNATPLNIFDAIPSSYLGGSSFGNWWQVYSATARTSSLAIGVVSGTCTCSFEFNGVVLNPSLSLAAGSTSISVNLQKGFNEILIVAPSNNGMNMSGFTFN